jgi:hypothetical protein
VRSPSSKPVFNRTSVRVKAVALALVLPALLLRGLVPVGFMPMALDGRLEIALCPGTVDVATFIAESKDPHARHHHQHHRSPACPYALSGSAMPAPVYQAHTTAAAAAEDFHSVAPPAFFVSAIVRVQLPRGPPVLS